METRCAWTTTDAQYMSYHDHEWGVPERDDARLLEMLVLEGAQAGLNWLTVLRRRTTYRQAFYDFDPVVVAGLSTEDLMQMPGLIHHEKKLQSAINNAKVTLRIQHEWGTLSRFLWQWVDGKPVIHHFQDPSEVPTQSHESHAMSQALKTYGMTFVGPTICYALMQATGMVNDHLVQCFRHAPLSEH